MRDERGFTEAEGRLYITVQRELVAAMMVWGQYAACKDRDPEPWTFDPDRSRKRTHALTRYAKKVCRACPVQVSCLSHALDFPETHGIWGGKTEDERVAMIRNEKVQRH